MDQTQPLREDAGPHDLIHQEDVSGDDRETDAWAQNTLTDENRGTRGVPYSGFIQKQNVSMNGWLKEKCCSEKQTAPASFETI